MAITLQQISKNPDLLTGGHRACAGCTGANIIRQVLLAAGPDTVLGCATGCMEVVTTIFPYTAWKIPFIHSAFENSAATVSGVETAFRALQKRGDLPVAREKMNFIAMGGDGGTYDIGLQSLSGAMERGHKMVYVCYDNEAYMNTGIQRSSATPFGAHTSTAPAGKVKQGKEQHRKDLTGIMVAHNIPYVAQTTPFHWRDLAAKVRKALDADGPAFLNIIMPCTVGWHFEMQLGMEMAKNAVESNFWPLFEVEKGEWKLNYQPKERLPIVEWLKPQGRFKHLFKPGNEAILEEIQRKVDADWAKLLKMTEGRVVAAG
jgi:pyruvate ferredoxin oxidoreductase beta subunit